MTSPQSTCWTVIQAAAAGCPVGREQFACRYVPVVRSCLAARWQGSPCLGDLDDAVQEVFVECFKPDGVLERADRDRGFRPFLLGVVRHVARRIEARHARRREQQPGDDLDLDAVAGTEESLAREFDRAWARALLREAARRQEDQARAAGAASLRRVELLRLRFHDGLPIREIAALWQADAAELHHEYARARQEFRSALLEVVAFHHPGPAAEVERQCADLLTLLG
jgi:RNA polymerase sigma-70 factor (ECF subfamily)